MDNAFKVALLIAIVVFGAWLCWTIMRSNRTLPTNPVEDTPVEITFKPGDVITSPADWIHVPKGMIATNGRSIYIKAPIGATLDLVKYVLGGNYNITIRQVMESTPATVMTCLQLTTEPIDPKEDLVELAEKYPDILYLSRYIRARERLGEHQVLIDGVYTGYSVKGFIREFLEQDSFDEELLKAEPFEITGDELESIYSKLHDLNRVSGIALDALEYLSWSVEKRDVHDYFTVNDSVVLEYRPDDWTELGWEGPLYIYDSFDSRLRQIPWPSGAAAIPLADWAKSIVQARDELTSNEILRDYFEYLCWHIRSLERILLEPTKEKQDDN